MEDWEAWDLGRCPVPIKLVRVKTGMAYTTFIDRDAVSYLRDYLRQSEFRGGRGPGGPLFVTRLGTPVGSGWISEAFNGRPSTPGYRGGSCRACSACGPTRCATC